MELLLVGTQQSYQVQIGDGTEVINLEGGPSRYIVDCIAQMHIVSCQWILDSSDYAYFMAFYRRWLRYTNPFYCNVTVEKSIVEKMTVKFIPGSLSLNSYRAGVFTVTCKLYVYSSKTELSTDQLIIDSYDYCEAP